MNLADIPFALYRYGPCLKCRGDLKNNNEVGSARLSLGIEEVGQRLPAPTHNCRLSDVAVISRLDPAI